MLRDGGVELQQPSAAAAASTPAGSKQPMKRQPPPILLAVDELHCIGCDLSAGGGVLAAALQEVRLVVLAVKLLFGFDFAQSRFDEARPRSCTPSYHR